MFNTQWEQYPFLYFWNSQNTYITGIEPAVMFVRDARRYWLWRHIANDEPMTCGSAMCTAEEFKEVLIPRFRSSGLLSLSLITS